MAWYDNIWEGVKDFAGEYGDDIIGAGVGAWTSYNDAEDNKQAARPYFLPGQQKAWETGMQAAQDIWNRGPAPYYPGQTVADLDPMVQKGQDQHLRSTFVQQDLANAGANAANVLAKGGAPRVAGFALPDQIGFGIPEEYQEAITNPIWRDLQEQVIPSLHTAATAQGAFGGSRMQQQKADATAQATERATEALIRGNLQARQQSIGQRAGDISAQLSQRGQDINQNQILNSALNSGVNAVTASQAQQLVPGSTAMNVGAQRTGYNQQLIDANKERWDAKVGGDEALLSNYFGWLGGSPNYKAGTSGGSGGDWMDILQGGLQGVNMNNIFSRPSGGTQTPPIIPPNTTGPAGSTHSQYPTPQY